MKSKNCFKFPEGKASKKRESNCFELRDTNTKRLFYIHRKLKSKKRFVASADRTIIMDKTEDKT